MITVHADGVVYRTPNEQGIGLDECCELVAKFLIEQSQAIQQGTVVANQKPETSLSIEEILAQMSILQEQLSEQIRLAITPAVLTEIQKQQRPGGNLTKTTPPTYTQTE